MTMTMTTHVDACAFAGRAFAEFGSDRELCCCDPDGSEARARLEYIERYRRQNVLAQRKVWYDRLDREVRVKDMSLRYKQNTLSFILRRASLYQIREYLRMSGFASTLGGEMAIDSANSMLDELLRMRADAWIEQQPLVRRLRKLIARGHDGPVG